MNCPIRKRCPHPVPCLARAVLCAVALCAPPAVAIAEASYEISIAGNPVDPARDLAEVDPAGHDLVLVQWQRFGADDVIRAIAATGARLVQPIAPVNYLVWADATQTQIIRELEGVRFAGVWPAEGRIAADVSDLTTRLRVTYVDAADLSDLTDPLLRPHAFAETGSAILEIDGDAAAARMLAGDPRVYSVSDAGRDIQLRDEQSSQIIARGTADGANTVPGYRNFLAEIGADGAGVVAHIMDGGVDFNHPDLQGQVKQCFDSSPTGALCETNNTDDAIGHGTHVLGVILATGTTPNEDLDGFDYGLGVAPGAVAVAHNDISLNSLFTGFPGGFTPAYQEAVQAGAIVSNNSWGPAGTPQGYDEDTREFDQIARDADPDSGDDRPLALSWSIMNGSGGTSSQGSPDEAKNILAVGASGARGARDPDDLCSCTAHGPALDGRRLVDFVAPGQSVVSTRATQGAVCGNNVVGGLVNIPPSPFHGPCTGTSFASPHVTGTISVFTDWFRTHVANDESARPTPPLFKAALANTADDLARLGGVDADGIALTPIPNNQQGWGRINLGNLIEAWTAGAVFVDQEVAFTRVGESFAVRIRPIDPARPLKVSLAWADAPGAGLGGDHPAWVNDLDLTVDHRGTRWFGNSFADGRSVAGGAPDRMNNLENVFVPEPDDGVYRITVEAANLMAAASPNVDETLWQDFALVVTNAALVGKNERINITDRVELAFSDVVFDEGAFGFDLALANRSGEAFKPSVRLDVVAVDSASGTVRVANADNGGAGQSVADAARFAYAVDFEGYSPFARFADGDDIGPRRIEFQNANGEPFAFDAVVTANRDDGGAAASVSDDGTVESDADSGAILEQNPIGLRFTIDPLTATVGVELLDALIEPVDGGGLL